jgi:hypothetical protein
MVDRQSAVTTASAWFANDATYRAMVQDCTQHAHQADLAIRLISHVVCDNPPGARALGAKAVQLFMEIQAAHEREVALQGMCFTTLADIVMPFPDLQIRAKELCALERACRLMNMYPEHAALQGGCCSLFQCMMPMEGGHVEEHRVTIIRNGGLRAIVAAMNRFPADAMVHNTGGVSLLMISRSKCKSTVDALMSEKAGEALVASMNGVFLHVYVVMETAVQAILYMVQDFSPYSLQSDTRQPEAGRARAFVRQSIPSILKALSIHHGGEDFLVAALRVIISCMREDYFADVIHQAKGIPVFVKCVKAPSIAPDMQMQIYMCITYSTKGHTGNQDACREVDAIDAIIASAKEQKDKMILNIAFRALQCITDGHEANKAYLDRTMPHSLAKKMNNSVFKSDVGTLMESRSDYITPEVSRRLMEIHHSNDPALKKHGATVRPNPDVLQRVLEERAKEKLNERCSGCGKSAEMCGLKQLMRCSACTLSPGYCGAECQRACWAAHKKECKANRKSK